MFEGIDTGDTHSFGIADSCLWGCGAVGAAAPFGIGLSVQLWEKDLGHVDKTLYNTAQAFQDAGPILTAAGAPAWVGAATSAMGKAMSFILGWADDDLLGLYTDSDAKYNLTMASAASSETTVGAPRRAAAAGAGQRASAMRLVRRGVPNPVT